MLTKTKAQSAFSKKDQFARTRASDLSAPHLSPLLDRGGEETLAASDVKTRTDLQVAPLQHKPRRPGLWLRRAYGSESSSRSQSTIVNKELSRTTPPLSCAPYA
jgi:hypothetical protein